MQLDGLNCFLSQSMTCSVFSFFLPEFKTYGRVGDAELVAPEGTLLDMPKIVALMNGLFSLVKYGLSNCYGGFGPSSG